MALTSIVTAEEFDAEVVQRKEKDSWISDYVGMPLDGDSLPTDVLPVYTDEVDLVDGESLRAGLLRLDISKNSTLYFYPNTSSTVAASNPKRMRLGPTVRAVDLTGGNVLLDVSPEIGWDELIAEETLALSGTLQRFANNRVAVGGVLSFITIGRIAATFQVVGGISLVGRRLYGQPRGTVPSSSLSIKRTLTFAYTGADQTFQIQAGETLMDFEIWGAGGSTDDTAYGGAGGYTWGRLAVTVSDHWTAVVGQSGKATTGTVYGFGGEKIGSGVSAGGLSGLFTGNTTIVATDTAKAKAIAGGGGAGKKDGSTLYLGGHGSAVHASYGANMKGQDANGSDKNASGGGYAGALLGTNAGLGGSGFLHADATRGSAEAMDGGTAAVISAPKGIESLNYAGLAGFSGQPGRIVVILRGP